jgi:anti-sigma B factor antagonist
VNHVAEVDQLQEQVESGVRIAVSRSNDATTIHLEGELDLTGQQDVREAVLEAVQHRPARLILDLSRLSFLDSSGVHVLLEATQQSAEQQTSLMIVPGPPPVQRPFEILGLTDALPFPRPTQE